MVLNMGHYRLWPLYREDIMSEKRDTSLIVHSYTIDSAIEDSEVHSSVATLLLYVDFLSSLQLYCVKTGWLLI